MRCERIREQAFTQISESEYLRRPYARVQRVDKKRVRSESPESVSSQGAAVKTIERIVPLVPRRITRHTVNADGTPLRAQTDNYLLPGNRFKMSVRQDAKRKCGRSKECEMSPELPPRKAVGSKSNPASSASSSPLQSSVGEIRASPVTQPRKFERLRGNRHLGHSVPYMHPVRRYKGLLLSREARTIVAKPKTYRTSKMRLLHARAVGATKLTDATNVASLTAANVAALAGRAEDEPRNSRSSTHSITRKKTIRHSIVSSERAISIASSCSVERRAVIAHAEFTMSSLRGKARKRVSSETSDRTQIYCRDPGVSTSLDKIERATIRNALEDANTNLRGKTLKRVASDPSSYGGCALDASMKGRRRSGDLTTPSEASHPRTRAASDSSRQENATSPHSPDEVTVPDKDASTNHASSSTSPSPRNASPHATGDSTRSPKRRWPVRLQTPKIYRAPFRSEKGERNLRAERRRNGTAWSLELSERTRIFGVPQDALDLMADYLSQSDKFSACMAHKLFHFTNEPRFYPIMDLTPVGASAAVSGRIRRPAEGSVHHWQLLNEFITTQKRFCEVSVINIQKRALFQLHDQLIPLFETHCPKAMTLMIQDSQSRIVTFPQSTISFLHRVLRGRQIKQVVLEDCMNRRFFVPIDSSVGETCAAFLSHGGQCQKKKVSGAAFCPVHAKKQPFGSRT